MYQTVNNLCKPKCLAAMFVSMLALFFSMSHTVAQSKVLHPKSADGEILCGHLKLIECDFYTELLTVGMKSIIVTARRGRLDGKYGLSKQQINDCQIVKERP